MNPSKMNPCKMNSRRPTPRHIIIKHSKDNLESSERDVNHHIQRIVNKIIRRFCRKFGGCKVAHNIQGLKEKNLSIKNPILAKLSFKNEGEIKRFSDKQKLRVLVATRPVLQDRWSPAR